MAVAPPPLPAEKSLRWISALNVFLPGAGLLLLGRWRTGLILAAAFLLCFISLLAIFLAGYARYLQIALGDDILKDGRLEQVSQIFPQGWMIGLAAAGLVIHGVSSVLFAKVKRDLNSQATN